MLPLILFIFWLTAVMRTGYAVKCCDCATGYHRTGIPPFATPTGNCWDKDFNAEEMRVIDCPYTCMVHGAAWAGTLNETYVNKTVEFIDSVPVITFHNTTGNVTYGQSITRQCGYVGSDYDFGKCKFSKKPIGLPTGRYPYLTSRTFCCANDFCNGFPSGGQRPPMTTARTTILTSTSDSSPMLTCTK